LLIIDAQDRLLLFRYVFREGALAGDDYWGTPGGALEDGETFEQAAIRELSEETGIRIAHVDPHIAEREFVLRVPSGEDVMAQERYFVVRVGEVGLSRSGLLPDEVDVIAEHKWWTREAIAKREVQIWPEDLLAMLASAGA